MKQMTITIGHNVGDGETVPHTHEHVIATACDILALQGYTAYECAGMWQGEREDSTRLELYGLTDDGAARIEAAIPVLATALSQRAIYIDVRPDTSREVRAYSPAQSHKA